MTEIYLCHACSCQERLRAQTAGQVLEEVHFADGEVSRLLRVHWVAVPKAVRARRANNQLKSRLLPALRFPLRFRP